MPERIIRRASAPDWPVLWPIWHEVVAAGDTFSYDPATTSDEARAGWLGSADAEVWLLADDDAVLGLYLLTPNLGGPGRHVANASYMVTTYARGHGVGRAMVEHSIARARQIGYRGVQFNAVAATNVAAIRLYEDLGFTTVGVIPGGFLHPRDGFVDLLIMYLPL